VAYEDAQPWYASITEYRQDEKIPETFVERESVHVTLMPERKLSKQLRRGIVLGYELGRNAVAAQTDLRHRFSNQIEVTAEGASIFKSRFLAIKIGGEQIEKEYAAVLETMARLGLHGAFKENTPLHITIADLTDRPTRFERRYMNGLLNEIIPSGTSILLEPLMIYPDDEFDFVDE
jgi:2'-5' RNA ligase